MAMRVSRREISRAGTAAQDGQGDADAGGSRIFQGGAECGSGGIFGAAAVAAAERQPGSAMCAATRLFSGAEPPPLPQNAASVVAASAKAMAVDYVCDGQAVEGVEEVPHGNAITQAGGEAGNQAGL